MVPAKYRRGALPNVNKVFSQFKQIGKPVKLGAGTAVLWPYKRKAAGIRRLRRALQGVVSAGYIVRINGKMRPSAWARLSDAPTKREKPQGCADSALRYREWRSRAAGKGGASIGIARQTGGE